jgi:lauroyl/myristoyl acyltransferase
MLTVRGVPLLVVTLVEPSAGLTELRKASRAQQGVETLVIGDDPFAAVEIIRRLEAGAVVALLVDRPFGGSATTVELFGQPFQASLAAAELARASGCVLLPGIMPRGAHGYAPEFFPPVFYDRGVLRDRAARQRLTQEIMRAFEPCLRQHLNQWYQFVSIWPR